MLVDPKALQHILQAAGYKYPKSAEDRQFLRMVTGEGLAWAHGMYLVYQSHSPVNYGLQVRITVGRERL